VDPAGPSPRARQRALLVPVLGAFLLMPPFVWLFAGPGMVFGVPLIVAYLFGVWLALIVVTYWLTRPVRPRPPHAAPDASHRAAPPPEP
jgi:membrane protein implicated in regulation of membrane protease activity